MVFDSHHIGRSLETFMLDPSFDLFPATTTNKRDIQFHVSEHVEHDVVIAIDFFLEKRMGASMGLLIVPKEQACGEPTRFKTELHVELKILENA